MIDVRAAIGQTGAPHRPSRISAVTHPVILSRCLACLIALWSCALPAAGLYSGEVPVASQADAERAEALKSALAQVVIRLTGDSAILARPDVARAVAGAERYVQQYQYQQDVVSDGGAPQLRLRLVAQFDRDAVDQMLRDLGLAAARGDSEAAPVETRPASYHVWVSGLRSAEDYARVVGTLARNELVRGVRAEQARGDGVGLRLDLIGPLSRLLTSLSGGPLRVTNAKPPVDGVDALLDLAP
jgi:hypothetical protein